MLPRDPIRRFYLGALAALFVTACALPAAEVQVFAGPFGNSTQTCRGWQCLAEVPAVILEQYGEFAWFANFALYFGVLLLLVDDLRATRLATVSAVAACVLPIWAHDDSRIVLLEGYWVWHSCMVLLLVASVHDWVRRRRRPAS